MTFADPTPGLSLSFPAEEQDRRTMPDGSELLLANGTITNTADAARKVPPILIVLRDADDRIVLSWVVSPPKAMLEPRESVAIHEAVTDVPKGARVAEIGWKPE